MNNGTGLKIFSQRIGLDDHPKSMIELLLTPLFGLYVVALPEHYGAWQTVYSRFRLWVESGIFERLFEALIDDPDMENLILDSTIVRAHQKATGTKKAPNVWSKIKPSA